MQGADLKKRRDLPAVLNYEACMSKKMLRGLPNDPWGVKQ
jgi:hypothetical protein